MEEIIERKQAPKVCLSVERTVFRIFVAVFAQTNIGPLERAHPIFTEVRLRPGCENSHLPRAASQGDSDQKRKVQLIV